MDLYYFDIYFIPIGYKKNTFCLVNNLDDKTNELIQLCIKEYNPKSSDITLFYTDKLLEYKNKSTNFLTKIIKDEYLEKYNFISCFYSVLLKYKFKENLFNESELVMNNLLDKFLNKTVYDNLKTNKNLLIKQQFESLHKLYAHGTNAYVLHLLKENNNYTLLPMKKLKNVFSGEGATIQKHSEISISDYISTTYIRNFYIPLFYAFKSSTLWSINDGCDFKNAVSVKGLLFNKDNVDIFNKRCKEIIEIKNRLNNMTIEEYNKYNTLGQIPIVCIGTCNTHWNGNKTFSEYIGWETSKNNQPCVVAMEPYGQNNQLNEILLNDLKIELVATNFKDIKIVEKLLPSHIKILPFELVEFFIYIHTLKYLV